MLGLIALSSQLTVPPGARLYAQRYRRRFNAGLVIGLQTSIRPFSFLANLALGD